MWAPRASLSRSTSLPQRWQECHTTWTLSLGHYWLYAKAPAGFQRDHRSPCTWLFANHLVWFLIPVRGYGFSQIWRGNSVISTSAKIIRLCSNTLHRVLQLSSKLSLTTHWERSLGGVTRSGSILKLEPILKWILLLQKVHSRQYWMHINWSRVKKWIRSDLPWTSQQLKRIIAPFDFEIELTELTDPRFW